MAKRKDLTGQQFGRWTVLEYAETTNHGAALWWCQCSCEKKTIKKVYASHLMRGESLSCGCINREISSENLRKISSKGPNKYDEREDCYYGYDDKGNYFIIDKEDYPLICQHRWTLDQHGYWQTSTVKKNSKVRMHRFILNPNDNEQIDHINHKRFDNRKINLRIVTPKENSYNRKPYKRSKSQFLGVQWREDNQMWVASICIEGKRIHLGMYKDKEDAIKARIEGEKKYRPNSVYREESTTL